MEYHYIFQTTSTIRIIMKFKCFIQVLVAGVLLILSTNMDVNAQNTVQFEIDDFEEVIELKGEKIYLKDPLMDPLGFILSDTLFFVRDKSSPAVYVISLNSGKTISNFCQRGRGPGELIGPFGMQYFKDERKFMIQDAIVENPLKLTTLLRFKLTTCAGVN